MRKIVLFFVFAALGIAAFTQNYVHRVLVLNEGYFDFMTGEVVTPPSIGAYDPATGEYALLNELEEARFISGIAMDESHYYVSADGHLLKYDRYTDELVTSTSLTGIRKLAVWNEQLIVTRGEFGIELEDYIRVLDKNSLATIYTIPSATMPYTTEGIVVYDNNAYIAVNNGFVFGGEVGMLAVLDLAAAAITATIDLGPNGINPDNIMLDGDVIYTLNNKDYSGSSVSSYRVSSGDLSTNDLINVTSGCGTSALYNSEVFYQDFASTAITRYDPETNEILEELELGNNLYGLTFDAINERFYAGVTDFFSSGTLYAFDLDGNVLDAVEVSVSPGTIALDVRTATGIEDVAAVTAIQIFPNPAAERIVISSAEGRVRIFNAAGNLVAEQLSNEGNNLEMDISDFSAGLYLVQVTRLDGSVSTANFIRQ